MTHVELIHRAYVEGQTIRISYVNAQQEASSRDVDVQWSDDEYFSGYCHLREEARTFRIDRTMSVSVVGVHQRPKLPAPDNRDYFGQSRAAFGSVRGQTAKRGCAPVFALVIGVVVVILLIV